MVQLGPPQEAVSDVLVIGSGAAGLRAAIAARGHGARVLLLSESPVGFRSNSAIARAIFATVGVWSGPGDSAESHLEDTLSGGRLINDRRLVLTMTRAVRRQVDDLQQFGVSFRRRGEELLVGRAPGHSYPRHVSVEANRGVNITRPMRHHAASVGVDFLEGVTVTRLLLAGDRVAGALGIDGRGQVFVVNAGSTVLATGGGGKTYLRTNNAAGSSGDGYVLAYEAGATLQDMEFVQFYPTAWGDRGTKMCFYEGLLPIGATIRNSLGEDILARHGIDDAATVTRDVLTRMISQEIAEGRGVDGHVIFDLTTVPGERARALQYGRMMSHTGDQDRIPVAPTVHHFMGGIKIGVTAETGAPGLWAAGEVCGGVHGANRLGGNALTEAFVFGTIAGERAAAAAGVGWAVLPRDEVEAEIARLNGLVAGGREEDLDLLERSLRTVMWEKAGVIRDGRGLEEACREIETLRERLAAASVADPAALVQAVKLSAMLAVGEMVCRAAWLRAESRGAHYRSDYPDEDNGRWLKNIEISCRGGQMVLDSSPVSIETGR